MCMFLIVSTDCLELLKAKAPALMQDSITSSNMSDEVYHSATDPPVPTDFSEQQGKTFRL